eukprot:m.184106 g.184106  ORF g.184106 m.184106 type:complete len:230 (-) comp18092_c2_seq6:34-723(-)
MPVTHLHLSLSCRYGWKGGVLYDIIFQTDTLREGAFLENVHRRFVCSANRDERRALEPACGTLRLGTLLASQYGWHVEGYDLSDASLGFARQRAERHGVGDLCTVCKGNMATFQPALDRFDMAYNLVSSFKHLTDADQARQHLMLVARALKPGGVYVLGLHLVDYDYHSDKGEREKYLETREDMVVDSKIFSSVPDKATRIEHVTVGTGESYVLPPLSVDKLEFSQLPS